MTARLFTASWRALAEASMLGPLAVQPVRISRGAPRFWPEADTFPAVDDLMPDGWMFGIKDLEKFGRCYRRKLHTIGLTRIRVLLDAIASGAGSRPLALACFEADVATCHRGPLGFAGWWASQTGERVTDLSVLLGRRGAVALVHEVEIEPATAQACDEAAQGLNAQKGYWPQLAPVGAERTA